MITKSLIFAALAASFVLAPQQGTLLRHELKENTTETYKVATVIKQTMTIPSVGDQDVDMKSTMNYAVKINKIDPATGVAQVDTVVSDMKTEADGMIGEMMQGAQNDAPKEIKTTGTLDGRNRFTATKKPANSSAQMILEQLNPTSSIVFIELPDKAVAVGDSWTFDLPKSPLFGKDQQKLTAKLTGERDGAWVVSVTGTIQLDADLTEIMKNMPNNPMAGTQTNLKGGATLKGEALLDKMSGKMTSYVIDATSKSTVSFAEQGISIDTAGTIKTVMTLQK